VSEPRARLIILHCSSCRGEEKFVWCILAVNFDLLNSIEIITVIAGAGIKVSVPIPDHLRDFGADHKQYEAMQIFPM